MSPADLQVRTADGRVGRVPSNKLEESGAGQVELRRSLSRSVSRRTLSTRGGHRPPPVPAVPALSEGRAGKPQRQPPGRGTGTRAPPAGLTKMEQIKWKQEHQPVQPRAGVQPRARTPPRQPRAAPQPPAGLTKMEEIKWKREQHLKQQQARAGYGGDPGQSAAPADVHLEAATQEEPAPSCLSHAGTVVGIELQRVAYSVWSKYLTAFSAGATVVLSATILVCENQEEAYISGEVTLEEALAGDLTSFHVMGALASLGVAVLLLLNERFWKLVPGRKEQKDGTLWIRMVLLIALLVLQVLTSPIWLGWGITMLPICITLAGMRHGERDQPWPVQRGATKLEREDIEERKRLRKLAREAGAASLCAEQIYRMKEEDTLGRHVILAVYILLNVYYFGEAYFRWVGIVDSQGTCPTLTSFIV